MKVKELNLENLECWSKAANAKIKDGRFKFPSQQRRKEELFVKKAYPRKILGQLWLICLLA